MALAADSRVSPFTVQEFSDLLSNAFNLQHAQEPSSAPVQRPVLSLTPPSPDQPLFTRGHEGRGSSSCPTSATDDEGRRLRFPSRDEGSPQLSPPNRSRTMTALRVFQHVRTRASAFVLRPRAPSPPRPSPPSVPFEPIPPLSVSPTLLPTTAATLPRSFTPLSMVDLNADKSASRRRSRASSLPRSSRFFSQETTPPPPLPGHQTRPNTSAGTRLASPDLKSFFDDSPAKSRRAYSRPSTSASTLHPLSRVTTSSSASAVLVPDGLPSFFEDSGYQIAKPAAPHYSRPSTPTGTASPRIHTRLPPLKKAKSSGHGLFARGSRKGDSKASIEIAPVGLGYDDASLWVPRVNSRAPSPLTCPREPPPVPENDSFVPPMRDSLEDMHAPLPPSYVFERRGSAQSNSTASTRSSSSLSSRISSIVGIAFPSKSKMRMHARSKLNLSIATGKDPTSTHSSPSTLSTMSSPTTPVSPTTCFSRSQPYIFPGSTDEHSLGLDSTFAEAEEEGLALDRVLTPEDDPFAKAEIVRPVDKTPRPPTPPIPRRLSAQQAPATGLMRTHTWDDNRTKPTGTVRRSRNSMPASPVSLASTFPSSCSVYHGREASPLADSPYTPSRPSPPSAWSPFSTPVEPSSPPRPASTPPSSPELPPSLKSKGVRERSPRSPPSPTMSAFPLPPRTLPARPPPPDRALPSPPLPPSPSSPAPPPVPPKDYQRVARAHQSLPPPPSPSTLESPSGSPSSLRSHRETTLKASRLNGRHLTMLPLGTGIRDIFPDAHPGEEDHVPLLTKHNIPSSSSLGAPWTGSVTSLPRRGPASAATPWLIRPVTRRRSADSTSTVTGSPTSSAVYEAVEGWESEASVAVAANSDPCFRAIKVPELQVDTRSLSASASSTLLPRSPAESTASVSESCTSALSRSTFYTARSSLRSGSNSPVRPQKIMWAVAPDSPCLGVNP
ncbi:hypothetical protein FKP32DRAFT_1579706 [Trametes sanguinea]|nr:hypothetical protein FKP32DRAFT_1579706 [Trametes sanguinea]